MKALKLLLLPYLAAVVAAAFLWPKPAEGFIGESSRIVFFHVPCAWTSTLAFLVAAGYSFAYLRRRNPWHDEIACAAVKLGLLFGVLTLVTGLPLRQASCGGRWWNWDPRESSYLLLVFLYAAYLFLRAAIDDPERRARIAAVYALFAVVLMPFLVFVAPRVTASLHPQTVINPAGQDPHGHADASGLLRSARRLLGALSLAALARSPHGAAPAASPGIRSQSSFRLVTLISSPESVPSTVTRRASVFLVA